MNMRLANEEVTLAHGGNTVGLRPSLRAATYLERVHDGFTGLERHILDFHFGTVREIIMIAATDRVEAISFLAHLDTLPLKEIAEITVLDMLTLCTGFRPIAPKQDVRKTISSGKPMAWADFYADLYERATGWLQWTPDTAWNATPTEVDRAFTGLVSKLKALNGNGDEDEQPIDVEQVERNEAEGLDPEFNRAALRALRAKIAGAP